VIVWAKVLSDIFLLDTERKARARDPTDMEDSQLKIQ